MRRKLSFLLVLALALPAGCARSPIPGWVPLIGRDAEEETTSDVIMGREGAPRADEGPCRRKDRRWRAGSRVCEDDILSQCFPDGQWRTIGSC